MPSRVDQRPTAERLREIAATLFAERGYAGTSLAEIASRLGIRKPSLYNYYASKDELFLELFEDSLLGWRRASRPNLDGAGNCRDRLHRHLRSIVDFARRQPHALALCRVAAVGQLEEGVSQRVEALVRRQRTEYRQRLEAFFAEALEAAEVVEVPVEALVMAWENFVDGVISASVFGIGRIRPALATSTRQLDQVWRLFWRGLAREPEAA